MVPKRPRFDSRFKVKVALDTIRSVKTFIELAKQFNAHPNRVTLWKRQLLESADQAFESTGSKVAKSDEPKPTELFEQIGRLKVELEWLKRKQSCRALVMRCWSGSTGITIL